ncbi:MAG: 2-oxoglutarate dehydrogenase E1 component [Deltaproteobacteria bacterium]|nr:2-oxoglutarate dehydrogenase E1 component [Deltaproteobacteria bacterium]
MEALETFNAGYIDEQYRRWKTEPGSVSRDWQAFFKGFEIAGDRAPALAAAPDRELVIKQSRVEALKYRYRDLGHLLACMDPLSACPTEHPLLSLEAFGLSADDLGRQFFTRRFARDETAPLKEIINRLRETYCRSIGVEYMHLQDPQERRWLQERMEPVLNRPQLEGAEKVHILEKLIQSAAFEQFLNKKYVGVTRFSLEGGDAVIPLLDTLAERLVDHGSREIILGMAHRGRLNVQAHILKKPYADIFAEFESCYDPDDLVGAGDVKYHNGFLADILTARGRELRIFLVNNPSHLEAVDPVVEGFARARQDMLDDGDRNRVLPLLIHGDAAYAGQGVVMETLNMSQLEGYRTGGTIHIVINNQIGYTTLPEDARSTRYSTDVAKMIMAPVFHVHGEDPEAVVHVARLAADYRMAFKKDVVIDLVCYRRYGHNEGDEPYFTQPLMYARIRQRPPLHEIYAARLLEEKLVTKEKVDDLQAAVEDRLDKDYQEVHGSSCPFPVSRFYGEWDDFGGRYSRAAVETGVEKEHLIDLARQLNRFPKDFRLFSKLERLLQKRLEAIENGVGIDWAGAEALVFAALLVEKIPVRLSGQDCARGTFSQRHSVLVDTETGRTYTPLNHLTDTQAPYRVYNSLLAEVSVMGFEYGYSIAQPNALILWEAQFGDFANNAQSVIDLFIASGEAKWQRSSGLVLLLPHGMEGLGPEHSSARLERFLQLCAVDNLQVCHPTTPAQYFHLLRRQVKRPFRKPLVVMTPKSLLRHPLAVSTLSDMAVGSFQEVLDDAAEIRKPKRVLLCSGKIYYALLQWRQSVKRDDVVIVRLEQLYPFPAEPLEAIARRYRSVREWYWVQEEPENMGAWQFVRYRAEKLLGRSLAYIGRPEAASPATGFPVIFKQQQAAIIEQAVGAEQNGQVS